MRILRDGVSPGRIPRAGLAMVGGYVVGDFAWTPAQWASFGDIPQVRINPIPTIRNRGNCADVEDRAFQPGDVPPWYDTRRGAGVPANHLSVYCDWDYYPRVIQAMGGRDYIVWIASPDLRGPFHGIAGDQATGANNGYDESQVWDERWLA